MVCWVGDLVMGGLFPSPICLTLIFFCEKKGWRRSEVNGQTGPVPEGDQATDTAAAWKLQQRKHVGTF